MIILRANEKIHAIYRRHRVVLTIQIILGTFFFLLIIIPIIFLIFSSTPSLPNWLIKILPEASILNLGCLLLFLLSLFLPILWQIIFLVVVDYYLDCWILTNERIISTESEGLFNRIESSIPYDKIQDVTIEVKGVLPALFNFGDIRIETAAELGKFTFRQIPNPEKIKEVIFEIQKEFQKSQLR
jgi:uncharacterized membrane protein YdbT with pleckstrin-like domain